MTTPFRSASRFARRLCAAGLTLAVGAAAPSTEPATRAVSAPDSSNTSPPHRRHHAVSYDPASQRVLVYGGQQLVSPSDARLLDDLWGWDGRQWTKVAEHTGIAMIGHKLFADGAGGVFARGESRGLTTRWDGHQWIVLQQDDRSQREMAAGAFDSRRHRFVLFGGHIAGRIFPRETSEFDGQQWSETMAAGPPAMLGGAMAYDSRRHVSVLFGGMDSTGRRLGETWEWDGSHWTRASSSGPTARFGAGMTYDAMRGVSVLFGGADSTNQKLDDTWLWDGGSWRRVETSSAPAPRTEGYLAYDERRGVSVLFGGEGAEVIPTLGDTWEWNGTRWTRVAISGR